MQTQIVRPQAVLVARTCAVRPANARGLAGTPLVPRTVVSSHALEEASGVCSFKSQTV
jgi:hypothetical protein